MKNFYSIKNAFIAVAVAVIGLAMASCNGKVSEIQKTIPADVDVVCALNVANILDNADCKATSEGIELSPVLAKHFNALAGESALEVLSKIKGVNYESVYIYGYYTGIGVVSFELTDAAAFGEGLVSLGAKKDSDNGFDVYDIEGTKLFVNGNVVWMGLGSNCNPEKINNILDKAKKESIADVAWKHDYLGKGQAVAMLLDFKNMPGIIKSQLINSASVNADAVKEMLDGSLAIDVTLEGLKMSTVFGLKKADGSKLAMNPGITGVDIDTDFLKYLNKDIIAVMAAGIPGDYDWDTALNAIGAQMGANQDVLSMVGGYLKSLDGKFMVAAGPIAEKGHGWFGLNINNVFDYWNVVACVGLKDGKSEEYLNQLAAIVDAQLPTAGKMSADGKTYTINYNAMTLYVGARGNQLVASFAPISDENTSIFKASDFRKTMGELLVMIPKGNVVMQQINAPYGVRFDIYGTADNTECVMDFELIDCEGKLLVNVINHVMSMAM